MSRSILASIKGGTSLAARAVHVIVNPQPRNLHESRQVLRVLKDFGEITMFRSLRNDPSEPAPNSVLAIYQTSDSASKILEASPLRFVADPPPSQMLVTSLASFGIASAFTDETSITAPDLETAVVEKARDEKHSFYEPASKEFNLIVDKSFADHHSHIVRQEYYWGFVRNSKTFAYDNLIKSVPLEGLATISNKPVALHNRLVKKNAAMLDARKTLRQLWEEGCRAPLPVTTDSPAEPTESRG